MFLNTNRILNFSSATSLRWSISLVALATTCGFEHLPLLDRSPLDFSLDFAAESGFESVLDAPARLSAAAVFGWRPTLDADATLHDVVLAAGAAILADARRDTAIRVAAGRPTSVPDGMHVVQRRLALPAPPLFDYSTGRRLAGPRHDHSTTPPTGASLPISCADDCGGHMYINPKLVRAQLLAQADYDKVYPLLSGVGDEASFGFVVQKEPAPRWDLIADLNSIRTSALL